MAGWVNLASTLSWLTCDLWHELQATSADGWALVAHRVRLASFSWQARHTALASLPRSDSLPLKRLSGFASVGSPACFSLAPWQLTQVGVRGSAETECLCPAICCWCSSWQAWQTDDASASLAACAVPSSADMHSPAAASKVPNRIRIPLLHFNVAQPPRAQTGARRLNL